MLVVVVSTTGNKHTCTHQSDRKQAHFRHPPKDSSRLKATTTAPYSPAVEGGKEISAKAVLYW